MFESRAERDIRLIPSQLEILVRGESNMLANLANASALINFHLDRINWCGFYLWSEEEKELVLGPFQGVPACNRIKPERGVCGASFSRNETLCIPDVNAFPGHIACDGRSLSEVVIPLRRSGRPVALLDIDSPERERFNREELAVLEEVARVIEGII